MDWELTGCVQKVWFSFSANILKEMTHCWPHFFQSYSKRKYEQKGMSLFKMLGGIKWALWLIMWCWTVWIVYIICLWPDLMTLCLLRSKIPSWNQLAMVFSLCFVCFCHFVLSSLAENVRASCSCCFLGLWPKMFGLMFDKHESTKEICITKTKVFSFPSKHYSESRQNVPTGIQRPIIDSCFLGQSTIFKRTCL